MLGYAGFFIISYSTGKVKFYYISKSYFFALFQQNIRITEFERSDSFMNISNQEYGELAKRHSHPSAMYKTIPMAFVIGGGICVIGEGLLNMFHYFGFGIDEAGRWTSMTLIFLSALLTGLKLYDRIAQHAGAGTLVPITGFANSVVSPALDFKSEGFVLGLGAKMFVIAGPVIVYGITASIVYGIIYYMTTLL